MAHIRLEAFVAAVLAAAMGLLLASCSGRSSSGPSVRASTDERDCLVRAMYFESNRSSYDGSVAVGTVVMNRVESRRFPGTICGVVGQHRQFASGVLTKRLDPRQAGTALRAADAVLKGTRHPRVGRAMHFHAASYKNPYPAKYVVVAGGNAFYLRPGPRWAKEYTGSVPAGSAPQTGPVKKRRTHTTAAVTGRQSATPCEAAGGTAALSLTCETETAGR